MVEAGEFRDRFSGQFKRPGDYAPKKVLEGRTLYSLKKTGRITGMKLPPRPPGLHYVTSESLPGAKQFTVGGCALPVLASDRILWPGQPILTAVGENLDVIDEWLSNIVLDINEDDNPLAVEKEFIRNKGEASDIIKKADHVVEETFLIPLKEREMKYESVTCLADGNSLHLYLEASWPAFIRKQIKQILQLPNKSVKVSAFKPGSSQRIHDNLYYPAFSAITAAFLSLKTRQSVHLNITPEAIPHGPVIPGAAFHLRKAVGSNGRILAIEGDVSIEAGALLPFESELIDRIILGIFSLYPCPHYHIKGCIHYNSLPPAGFGPAAGLELGYLAGELLASHMPENSHLLPSEWKRRILPEPHQTMGGGISLPKDFSVPELLEELLPPSDFERKFSSSNQNRLNYEKLRLAPEYIRGVGLTCAGFGNGLINSFGETQAAALSITLDMDGKLRIRMPSEAPGPLREAWTAMAVHALGIDEKDVEFDYHFETSRKTCDPAILGSHVSVYTRQLEQAFSNLSKRRFREALPITIDRVNRRSSKTRDWKEMTVLPVISIHGVQES